MCLFTTSMSVCLYWAVSTCFLTDNLVENLLGDFEYDVQVPYLLYRNAAQEVNGIWFYNSRECEEVANLFSRYDCYTCHCGQFSFYDLQSYPCHLFSDAQIRENPIWFLVNSWSKAIKKQCTYMAHYYWLIMHLCYLDRRWLRKELLFFCVIRTDLFFF